MKTKDVSRNGHIALSADQILKADDLPKTWVPTPDWSPKGTDRNLCGVFVRTMTATERDAFEVSCLDGQGKARNLRNLRARLCSLCMVDAKGERLFDENQANDLGGKSGQVMDVVFDAAQRLNGITKGDVKELAEN